jgi:glutamate--cysteine ligase
VISASWVNCLISPPKIGDGLQYAQRFFFQILAGRRVVGHFSRLLFMVPRLSTALSGQGRILELERRFLDNCSVIEPWLRQMWLEHAPPFYASVDLRNAGYKLAPVDTNLFPGGFNNLNPAFRPLCVQALMSAVANFCPTACRVLVIPENHTRNLYYLMNVATLVALLKQAGLDARVGSLLPDLGEPLTIDLPDGQEITLEPVVRHGARLGLADFDPCAILLNNDLSGGLPDALRGLDGQTLLPPVSAGWFARRKSRHFAAYSRVANEFAALVDLDAWRINPLFDVCEHLDFQSAEGQDALADTVERLLDRVREKYAQHGIKETPYAVVKADRGTYGMGVMTVKSGEEVRHLSRRQRNKMGVVKEGLAVTEVLVQEGVPTFETMPGAVAEPVVYLIDRYVVGGFYRVHAERQADENLNAPGQRFTPLAFETGCHLPNAADHPDAAPNRFYAYGVVGRLAALAAAIEIEEAQ